MIHNLILEYRVWIPSKQRMVHISDIDYENERFAWYDGRRHWFSFSKGVLMQSTGKTDNKGEAIYVGDIVRFFDSSRDSEGDVDCVPVVGEVRYDEETMSYYFTNRIEAPMDDILDGEYPVEVLGNIYQNPELMEVGK